MAYRIDYEHGGGQKQPIRRKRPVSPKGILCVFGMVALLVVLTIPPIRIALRNWVLPGDGAVTAGAIQGMVEDLQSGDSVGEAIMAFCQEIITSGA